MRRCALALLALGLTACHPWTKAGFLSFPEAATSSPVPCALPASDPLASCAPVILQATHAETLEVLDRPVPLDADGSRRLADDLRTSGQRDGHDAVPFYASAQSDATHHYLFYGLYYVGDWSGHPRVPHIDHVADFEGLLVVVSRATGVVEATITQAHRLLYLWRPDCSPHDNACSGKLGLTSDGRPIIFA